MSNLHLVKTAKLKRDDEYYTLYDEIEKELKNYDLKDKLIYCNCDNENSNFVKWMKNNKMNFIYSSDDFRKQENLDKLKKSDIVITNPPFSVYGQFYEILRYYKKDFILIAPRNFAMRDHPIEDLVKQKIFVGGYKNQKFLRPDGKLEAQTAIWITTFKRTKPFLNPTADLKKNYECYDNYNCININRIKDIPKNYYEEMGVPFTYIFQWNPEEYKIIGLLIIGRKKNKIKIGEPIINGKIKFPRLIIKKIKET